MRESISEILSREVMTMNEILKERLIGIFDLLNEFCTDHTDCDNCPFTKMDRNGDSYCRFRDYSGGHAAWDLKEIFFDCTED